jgi:hypothetical protein
VSVDGLENLARETVRLQQMSEFQQRRRLRCRLAIEVDADEATDRLAVVNRIFNAFVGQTKTLLSNVHAQHARQANWRATGADHFGVKRFDHLMQLAPLRDLVDLGKKAIAPGQFLLRGIFEVEKIFCMIVLSKLGVPLLSQVLVLAGMVAQE